MLQITNEGSKVRVQIEAGVKVAARWFQFNYDTQDEVYAELLARDFNKRLQDKISAARQEAYNQGYKAAKAKEKKETWFSGWL